MMEIGDVWRRIHAAVPVVWRIYQEELLREPDPACAGWVATLVTTAASEADVRAAIRMSQEYADVHAPKPEPEPEPQPEPVSLSPIRVDGRRLVRADGRPWVWRGATAFRLVELVAHGRESDAVAWLQWARGCGFNVARVLTMCRGMFSLSPEDGRAALARTLDLARQHGIWLHVTCLADTRAIWQDQTDTTGRVWRLARDHVAGVGVICAAADNVALVEVANEPYHPTQADAVHDVTALRAWAATVPSPVVALGAAADDEDDTHADGANAVTVHLDRGRDEWNMVRRVREIEALSSAAVAPALNTEPIGFAEQGRAGSRSANPSIAAAFGALSRVFDVPSTWHSDSGLHCTIPGPQQEMCARAFVAGTQLVPDGAALSFRNTGWPNSPVTRARFAEGEPKDNACVRAYSGIDGDTGILVLLGVRGNAGIEMGSGWKQGAVLAEWPELRVIAISR
jgi:hypothetical protein